MKKTRRLDFIGLDIEPTLRELERERSIRRQVAGCIAGLLLIAAIVGGLRFTFNSAHHGKPGGVPAAQSVQVAPVPSSS